MPRMKLTEQAVKRLSVSDGQIDYRDTDVGRGVELTLRIGPQSKTWTMRYRLPDGRRRRLKLGYWVPAARSAYGADFDPTKVDPGNLPLTIPEARALARVLSGRDDPQAERLAKRRSAKRARSRTVEGLVADFLEYQEEQGVKSRHEQARMLTKDVKPLLWDAPVAEVDRADVEQVLARIKARGRRKGTKHGGLVAANRMKSLLVQLFNFGLHDTRWRKHIRSNPAAAVRRPLKGEQSKIVGDRVLTDQELKSLWLAADRLHPVICAAYRFRLATGQRQTEILGARWDEFQPERMKRPKEREVLVWHIPRTRTKKGTPHSLPLPHLAEAILSDLRATTGQGEFVFASPRKPGQAVGRPNRSFRRWAELAKVPELQGTDIRRTVNTSLARLGVRHEVKMAVMNHAPADVNKRHYDRYDYFPEKLAALEMWNRHLEGLIAGEAREIAAVVPIRT